MADGTGISWTDATWNPVRGCSRVSEGCRNCYAERVAARFSGPGQPYEDLADRERKGSKWTGVVRLIPAHLADPLRWRRPRRIFVNSMSDLFHESLTNEEIAAVFGVMAAAPQHTFQVLTKRARRMREWFEWIGTANLDWLRTYAQRALDPTFTKRYVDRGTTWPLPNVWIGVSVENQEAADERIPDLVRTPAAVRFLSCEPLLGPVVIAKWMRKNSQAPEVWTPPLDWVIAGCESGPGARSCEAAWLRSLMEQCATAGVARFLKQARARDGEYTITDRRPIPIVAGRIGELLPVIGLGVGSKEKGGGVIELPYLDGGQHAEFPR